MLHNASLQCPETINSSSPQHLWFSNRASDVHACALAQLFEMLKKDAVAATLLDSAGDRIQQIRDNDRLISGQALRLVQQLELFV